MNDVNIKSNIFLEGYFISDAIISLYDQLIECDLYLSSEDDYDEATIIIRNKKKSLIKQIKELIIKEDEAYKKLSSKEINDYLNNLDMALDNPVTLDRYGCKLLERSRIHDGEIHSGNILSGDVISSKILIETLKKMKNEILLLEDGNFKDAFYSYFSGNIYDYLIENAFIEKLSNDYLYDLDSIPNLTYDDILNLFKKDASNYYQNVLVNKFTIDLIELFDFYEMSNSKFKDSYDKTFLVSLLSCEIEVIINNLNKNSLLMIYDYINSNHIDNINNDLNERVKKLVMTKIKDL